MAKKLTLCANDLAELLGKKSRATLSATFFRQTVARKQIEGAFLTQLYDYCLENKSFVVIQISVEKYLLVRTTDKYLPEDPGAPLPEEDEE